jgi:hypothetical protein
MQRPCLGHFPGGRRPRRPPVLHLARDGAQWLWDFSQSRYFICMRT